MNNFQFDFLGKTYFWGPIFADVINVSPVVGLRKKITQTLQKHKGNFPEYVSFSYFQI